MLRRANAEGRAAIAAGIAAAPREAHRAIHDYAWLIDRIVDADARPRRALAAPAGQPDRVRADLHAGGRRLRPRRDGALLRRRPAVRHPLQADPWGESLIESVLYCLWDLRLKVGHAVRTIDECLRLARADVTIRTSLLEHRYLWGDRTLALRLDARLWNDLFAATGPEFVELKLAERRARHAAAGQLALPARAERQGGQGRPARPADALLDRQVPEPRLDPGGPYRDGVFTAEEYRIFAEAEAFLWTTRVHLHLLTGRASEQLTFDTQVEIADTLGYRSTAGQRGGRALHAGLLHPRQARRRPDPHLPRRARGAAREAAPEPRREAPQRSSPAARTRPGRATG